MFRAIREQIETIFREDPAAKSVVEIVLCYPGFHAILVLRWSRVRYHLKDETSCFEARPIGRPSA